MKIMLKKMVSTKFMDLAKGEVFEANKVGDRYLICIDKTVSIMVDKKSVKEVE